jgi:nicotinate-nucleotide adenylyltransferase
VKTECGVDLQPPRSERIGLFGGTFDPPHNGHVAAAIAARDVLGLDRVLLVVANSPWQKVPHRTVTPAEDRYAMVRAAVNGVPALQADRTEIDRGGESYTIETVETLLERAHRRGLEAPLIFLVVGADVVPSLPTWERVDALRQAVTLAVVVRPGLPPTPPPAGWQGVEVPGVNVDVSSSQVRTLLERNEPVEWALPPAVIRCIRRRHLYAMGQ